ncbi:MAG: NUDIX hydrolase [Planctomycetota bacterium]|jgi:8-oxo-dGTP pyrophosphatase MutT (NUDIX family)
MHRRALLGTLETYLRSHPDDLVRVDHVRQFVRLHEDCFLRSCVEGHVTGSAWVVSPDRSRVLLVHHRRLDRWLQPGGHADGDPLVHRVALREACEETGLGDLELAGETPIDIDVHPVPGCGSERAHLHHDIRYLVVANGSAAPQASEESNAVRWFARAEIEREIDEESLLRMVRRIIPG